MEKLLEILKELHEDVDYASCVTLIDDGILDSFDIVTLVAEISEEFDISIPAEKLIPENFNSATAIMALINSLED